MEARLEFRSVVGLHDVDSEGQSTNNLVDESNSGALIARVVDFQNSNSSAVIDGGELIQALPSSGNTLEKLHVHLQPMTRLRLLVTLPALRVLNVLLTGWQAVHPVPSQNSV